MGDNGVGDNGVRDNGVGVNGVGDAVKKEQWEVVDVGRVSDIVMAIVFVSKMC